MMEGESPRDSTLMRLMRNLIFWSFLLTFLQILYCITVEICDIALFAFCNRINLPSLGIAAHNTHHRLY